MMFGLVMPPLKCMLYETPRIEMEPAGNGAFAA